MAQDRKNFFITGIDNLPDPVRNTRWRVLIPTTVWNAVGIAPSNGQSFGDPDGDYNFSLHVKSAKIPEISLTEGQHYYMGFNSNYPTGAKLSGEMPFSTILLEDMRAYEAMLGWNAACLNTGILMPSGPGETDRMTDTGIRAGLGIHKDLENSDGDGAVLRNSTVKIEMYNWMTGEPIITVTLHNAWPKAVGGFELTYKEAALIEFNFTLIYDRWTVQIAKPYKNTRDGTKEIG